MNIQHFNGACAEAQFVLYAMESEWEIAKPFIESSVQYDFLIKRSSESPWEKVQVKHAFYHVIKGRRYLQVNCLRGNGGRRKRYKEGDFDLLFVFHKEGRWLFPWDYVKKRYEFIVGSPKYDLYRV